jgi:hypothetical protein
VVPFFLHYIAETLLAQAGAAARLLRRPGLAVATSGAVLALLLLPNLAQDQQVIARNLQYLGGDQSVSGITADEQTYLEACRWLHDHTPPGSVVLSRKSSITEIYAGRPSELIPLIPPEEYLAWLQKYHVAYILDDSFPWSTHTLQYLRPAMARYPDHFRLVHTTRPPEMRIWEFVP